MEGVLRGMEWGSRPIPHYRKEEKPPITPLKGVWEGYGKGRVCNCKH